MKTLHELAFPVTDVAAALDWYRGAEDGATVFDDGRRALITHKDVALLLVNAADFPGCQPLSNGSSRPLGTQAVPA